jgi:hypothetical protein
MLFPDYSPDAIDVQIADLLVATADGADAAVDGQVQEVLKLLREKLDMDVVFVSRFEHGRRTILRVEHRPGWTVITPGQSDPLEESWCQRVVDGRLPNLVQDARPYIRAGTAPAPNFPVGTHLSTPVAATDGSTFGTLCCFSFLPKSGVGGQDLKRLEYAAQLLTARLQKSRGPTSEQMQLQPRQP